MKKICIEALGIHYSGGGRSSIIHLLDSLFKLDKENQYLLLLNQPESKIFNKYENVETQIVHLKNRFLLRIWAQLYIPKLVKKFDLIHFTKNLGIFGVKTPSVVTVHDLTTIIHPELFSWIDVVYWRYVEKYSLNAASKIIAVSKNTARDVINYYGINPKHVEVIYNAIAPHFEPASKKNITNIKNKFMIESDYIIHVGRIDRKKNLTFLVEVFNQVVNTISRDLKLVIAGEVYRKSRDLSLVPTIEHLQLQDRVIFTGFVPDEDLPALYSGALVAVYPSWHEGFGLAQIEAMACGTPLVAHQAGAVSEVVGDAGMVIDSMDCNDYSQAIAEIIENEEHRVNLTKNGLKRAEFFKGDLMAKKTLHLYGKVLENSKLIKQ